MTETHTHAPRVAGRVVRIVAAVAMAAGLSGGVALASQGTASAAPANARVQAAPVQQAAPAPQQNCWWGWHDGYWKWKYVGRDSGGGQWGWYDGRWQWRPWNGGWVWAWHPIRWWGWACHR